MFISGFNYSFANAIQSVLNGKTLKIYKGVMPTDVATYEATDRSADLLATSTIPLTRLGINIVSLSNAQSLITPTATGLATWFIIIDTTTNRILMSDVGSNTETGQTLTLSNTNLTTGVDTILEGFELTISNVIGAL